MALSPCSYEDCSIPTYCRGWCKGHYTQVREGRPLATLKRMVGGTVTKDGYRQLSKNRLEHRVVMEGHMGRSLLPGETVHHINGDRLDNRLENLELWVADHGPGQRVSDRVELAVELLRIYAPEVLA